MAAGSRREGSGLNILLTGGTGFIGRALCAALEREGHALWLLTRRGLSPTGRITPFRCFADLDPELHIDAVINLAGEGIADRPWTRRRREQLRASRIGVTRELIGWLNRTQQQPAVFLSGSAIGFYGDRGDVVVGEDSPAAPADGGDFARQLCIDWEAAALRDSPAARSCILRIGLVLAPGGGFLQRMLLPFRLGLGGPIGSGRQWMSWIHRDDLVRLILWLLEDESRRGVFNATAPAPVRNADFARSLGAALHRPARLPLPAFLLRLLLGDMAGLLLGGQRVLPARALAAGFTFSHADLGAALAASLR